MEDWPSQTNQPFGVLGLYSWKDLGAIFHIIEEYQVDLFVEIGVGKGGLAAWMLTRCYYSPEFMYRGILLDPDELSGRVEELAQDMPNARIVIGSCFSDGIQQYVKRLIELSRVAFLLCGGCDKSREFQEYMNIIRPGDVLAAHGFPLEISLSCIKPFVDDEKLKRIAEPYLSGTTIVAGVRL